MAAMPNVPCSKRRDAAVARCSNHLARSSSTTDAAAGGTITTHAALGLGAAKRSLDRALAPYDGLWSRVLPMTLLFGVMSFCNCILDATKDTLVVTAFGGAEQIPWLTVWAVLPLSIVVLAVYSVASQRMFGRGLFYVSLAPFVAFFAVFTFVLYPNHASLHPHALITQLTATLPPGLTGLLAIIDNWTYTLFYAFAELWGDVVLSLLFWAYANDTTTLEDAALVYPLFGIGANIAQYVGGVLLCFVRTAVPVTATRSADAAWDIQLRILMSCVLVGSAVLCGIYEFTRKRNKADEMERVKSESRELEEKSSKPAVSLGESLGMLVRSPQIQCLTVMALAQGITANVFQVAWKGQMRDIFPLPADYSAFMGVVSTWQAVVTCICMLGAPYIFRKWGWAKTTALTPWVILWAGGAWMAASAWLPGVTSSMMGVPMLSILCMAGAAVYVFEKATKFSVFKPAEEMVYIGLDENAKTRGKASVDILGGQLGKSGGSVLIQGLLLCSTTGHLAGALPVLFTVHTIVAGMWIAAVSALAFHHGDLLDALTSVDDDDKDTADLVCDLQQPA
ncbi:hypothetical protein PPROV_000022300 [Pycnococcus provasolii]|uniref:ADP,ATP carrier protein n=1 Tax=Pycnococcus provasolii TaxID=41880 RepID=A0A830H8L1_9CHLO|nr:hypothetical protein PPROV_000022300 [Pycnococcus provasolii]